MGEAKENLLPHFLKASSPEKLQEEMLHNNLIMHGQVKYQDISELKDGSFICWYYKEVDFQVLVNKATEKAK